MQSVKQSFDLTDKVTVITGGAGLLGQKHAEAIASFGGSPVLLDLENKSVEDLANELNEKFSVNSTGYVVDVTSESEIQHNCNDILKRYGDILMLW
tara:strand:+ start:267 stop:554 length:288 start_codon:yes stop_codon:yes gene_type:complete